MVKHMSQLRLVDTPDGPITYTLTRKRVKRLILSVEYGGAVFLSVPLSCSLGQADDFVREKRGWLQKASERRKARQRPPLPHPTADRQEKYRYPWDSHTRRSAFSA